MKNFVLSTILLISLNACSVPLVGSLTSSGISGAATGKYHQSFISGGLDIAVHHATGKTPGEHVIEKFKKKQDTHHDSKRLGFRG